MNPKTDPYATKTQKRVDLFLLIFIVVILALLLRPAAHGDELRAKTVWQTSGQMALLEAN